MYRGFLSGPSICSSVYPEVANLLEGLGKNSSLLGKNITPQTAREASECNQGAQLKAPCTAGGTAPVQKHNIFYRGFPVGPSICQHIYQKLRVVRKAGRKEFQFAATSTLHRRVENKYIHAYNIYITAIYFYVRFLLLCICMGYYSQVYFFYYVEFSISDGVPV